MLTYNEVLEWWRAKQFNTEDDYISALENFRVVFTCNSSAIEGNKINYHTTRELFEEGKVSSYSGNVRDLMEIQNQKFAFAFMIKSLLRKTPISKEFLLKLHKTLLYGCYDDIRWNKGERPGSFKKGDYVVGLSEEGAMPDEVDELMTNLIDEINNFEGDKVLVAAAYFHLVFEQLHPFADGNGRVGRAALNYFLMLNGYPPTIIFDEDKDTYYMALEVWDRSGELKGFVKFLEEQTIKTWSKHLSNNTYITKFKNYCERLNIKDVITEINRLMSVYNTSNLREVVEQMEHDNLL